MKKILIYLLLLSSFNSFSQLQDCGSGSNMNKAPYFYKQCYLDSIYEATLAASQVIVTNSTKHHKSITDAALAARLAIYNIPGIKVNNTRFYNSAIWNTNTDGAEAAYLNDTLFQIGGWFTGKEQYYSLNDGQSWTRARDADFSPRHTFPMAKKGNFYYITGSDGYDTTTNQNAVWRSRNLLNWTKITDTASWPIPRVLSGIWVKGDTIYSGGGQTVSGVAGSVYRDLWKSTDGITWTSVCAACLPNIGNLAGTFTVKNDTAYIIAGGTYLATYSPVKTVYRSTNMRTWTLVTSLPSTSTGFMYPKAFVINNMLCTYGGYYAINHKDLFCSYNGNTWFNFKDTTFPGTHAAALAVKNNTSFIISSGSDITSAYKFDFNSIINGDTLKKYNSVTSQRNAIYSYNNNSATTNRVPYYRNGNTLSDTTIFTYKDSKLAVGTSTPTYNGMSVVMNPTIGSDASIPSFTVQNPNTGSGSIGILRTLVGTGYGAGYPELWIESSGGTGGKNKIRGVSDHDLTILTNDVERIWVKKTGEVGIGATPSTSAKFEITSTTKGFMPPSMTSAQVAAISSPATGLQVYNSDARMNMTYSPGWGYFKSTGVNAGSFSQNVTAVTTFQVAFDGTQPNTTYSVLITPTNILSAALFYVTNKTTTTFDVVYLSALTGVVAFDYLLAK